MPETPAPPPTRPLRRSSLRQQIADALRDEVITGRLPAGRHFTVKEIADLYGVSATPVREALVDLAAQGLLEVEHHRGYRVRRFTRADFHAMVEALDTVCDGLFRRAADRGQRLREVPAADLASVRRRAQAAARAARAAELDVLIVCDLRFWQEAAALSGNAHLCEFLDRLRVRTWVYAVPHLRRAHARARERGTPEGAGLYWDRHPDLADAVEHRDAEAARGVVESYHRHTLALLDRLDSGGPAGGNGVAAEPS
jgi:DNA-binding GntR family transcriptional regulator